MKFGFKQIQNETPIFAKWIFRSWFFISKIIVGWLGYTHLISDVILYEIIGVVTLLIDPLIFVLSKMFGIKEEEKT